MELAVALVAGVLVYVLITFCFQRRTATKMAQLPFGRMRFRPQMFWQVRARSPRPLFGAHS